MPATPGEWNENCRHDRQSDGESVCYGCHEDAPLECDCFPSRSKGPWAEIPTAKYELDGEPENEAQQRAKNEARSAIQ